MNPKKYLENRIRGWLPKEPNLQSYQPKTNHKPPKITLQIAIIIFIMGFVGGLLGAFASSVGLFSELGVYVSLVMIVIGITIVAATIIIRNKAERRTTKEVATWATLRNI